MLLQSCFVTTSTVLFYRLTIFGDIVKGKVCKEENTHSGKNGSSCEHLGTFILTGKCVFLCVPASGVLAFFVYNVHVCAFALKHVSKLIRMLASRRQRKAEVRDYVGFTRFPRMQHDAQK